MASGAGRLSARVRRRRIVAVGGAAALAIVIVLVARSCGGDPAPSRDRAAAAAALAQLPRGGRTLFPRWRVVAFYGNPQDRQLGVLGIGTPAHAARRLERTARRYRPGDRPVLPAMELISSVAASSPGADGLYRTETPFPVIRRYLRAARRAHMLLILDIQPGHADFLAEVRRLEPFLRRPDVALALDPEWKVPDGEVPGKVIGSTDAATVNAVSALLDRIVVAHRLPQKLLVIHQFTVDMVRDRAALTVRRRVPTVLNIDGFGTRVLKLAKYRELRNLRVGLYNGFKLFFHEDTGLMAPSQVLRMRPRPDLVVYE